MTQSPVSLEKILGYLGIFRKFWGYLEIFGGILGKNWEFPDRFLEHFLGYVSRPNFYLSYEFTHAGYSKMTLLFALFGNCMLCQVPRHSNAFTPKQ